jgi:hypothetical protein
MDLEWLKLGPVELILVISCVVVLILAVPLRRRW